MRTYDSQLKTDFAETDLNITLVRNPSPPTWPVNNRNYQVTVNENEKYKYLVTVEAEDADGVILSSYHKNWNIQMCENCCRLWALFYSGIVPYVNTSKNADRMANSEDVHCLPRPVCSKTATVMVHCKMKPGWPDYSCSRAVPPADEWHFLLPKFAEQQVRRVFDDNSRIIFVSSP